MLHDIRVALRSLARTPGFTLVVVLTLALAIGANTSIFTVVDGVLLRPLPYHEPDRLMMLWERQADEPDSRNVISPENWRDWRSRLRSVEDAAAVFDFEVSVTGLGDPEQVPAQAVTASTFPVLGVNPMLGRTFTDEEDTPEGPAVAVLSHAYWESRFGRDPAAVGRSLTVNGTPFEVIGIMPPGFNLPESRAQLWVPLSLDPAVDYRVQSGRFLRAFGRLAPDATAQQAEDEIRSVARQLEQEYPAFNTGWSATAIPLAEQVVGGTRRALLVLVGVVAFVLLIACANIANLQLARAVSRRREVAVRAALGASRERIVRDQLVESLVLAAIGGVLGLLLAVWATEALVRLAPASLPRAGEIEISARTFAFTSGLVILSALLFGLLPGLTAARIDLQSTLKEGGRGSAASSGRGALVAVQIALSLVLLVGAGLMLRSFARLSQIDPGFKPENVLTAKINLPASRYETPERQTLLIQQLLERVRALPGVTSASATSWPPFERTGTVKTSYWLTSRPLPPPGEEPGANISAVDPEYFRTMGIEVVRGEPFTYADGAGTRMAVVVDEELVRTMFPDEDPIGQHLKMEWGDTLDAEIVAVVRDVHQRALDSLPEPTIYWAHAQFTRPRMHLVIRTAGAPSALIPAVREQLQALDPELPLADPKPLTDYLGDTVAARRFTMLLLGGFAAVALVLAAVGIGGVVANGVAQRTREIGVRMALGARRQDVLRMIMRQGMLMAGAGIAAGIIGALVLTRVIASLLYGTSPTDPITFTLVAAGLASVAAFATFIPARRATRVDPLVALREE